MASLHVSLQYMQFKCHVIMSACTLYAKLNRQRKVMMVTINTAMTFHGFNNLELSVTPILLLIDH